jgi:hypothetical protein
MAYRVFVVAQDGTPFDGSGTDDQIADARVDSLSWELNGPGSCTISLPTTHVDAALLIPGREIQVYDGTDLLWWGPIVRPQGGLDESSWQCAGLLWYFQHRFMGRADRVNQITNGDFEDGETDWTFHNGVTHSIDSSPPAGGPGGDALLLEGMSADHDGYAEQVWTHPAGGYPTGDYLTLAVWVYIPSADYIGGAASDLGLVAIHADSGGNFIGNGIVEIGDDTPKDQWIALETGVPNVKEDDTVTVRLFPPHGTAYFDLVTLTYMESLSFGGLTDYVEVTDIIEGIVAYAQDRAPYDFDHGKSDLNIDGDGDDTGVTRNRTYQFEEHRNILDATLEFVRDGTCDISIEITSTTRTFTVWPKSTDTRTPKLGKGVLYGTTLELDVNLAGFTYAQDLEQAASSVILLGPGDGPDRPEGGAIDASFVGGAFTSEIVEQAPDTATIGQLDDRAAERLAVAARPELLEVTTLPGAGVIGDLAVGDTVPIVISRGWVDIDDTYRVVHIEADLLQDQATITLNALPAEVI